MKISRILLPLVPVVACIMSACEKSDPPPDYSSFLLSKVQYSAGKNRMPYRYGNVTIEYDNLKRLKRKTYEFGSYTDYSYEQNKIIEQSSYVNRKVYTINNNGRIVSHIEYPSMDSTFYEYDVEGYLINKRVYRYIYAMGIWQDFRYTYQGGNLIQRVDLYYGGVSPNYYGADTLTYSYDNSAWFPQASNLYQVTDVLTGKPNRNNITDIRLKKFENSFNDLLGFGSIHYTYTVRRNRLETVTMDFTPLWGVVADTAKIDFTYQLTN
jgi:hypothetical protein